SAGEKSPCFAVRRNCDGANESLPFPKEQRYAVGTLPRRHVTAIKAGSYEAAAIAKKIIQAHQLFAWRGATLESFCREEIVRYGSRPFCNRRSVRVLLERQADGVTSDCGGEQALDRFPD